MTIHRIAAALACALLLAGCLPVTSKNPVGTTTGLGADQALYGTWIGHNPDNKADKSAAYFHFLQGKDGTLAALMVFSGSGKDDGWSAFNVRTAVLGKNHFLNAVETLDNGEPTEGNLKTANIPLLYSIKGRTLTLYLLEEDKVKEAVKAGAIAATVEPRESGDVVITADAAALDAYMTKPEAAKLFKILFVLKKME
jgi:hypothetical protein